jgi:hypothetical protein
VQVANRGRGLLEIVYDLLSDDVGIGEVGAVFERLVFEAEDVELEFVARMSFIGALTTRCERDPSNL